MDNSKNATQVTKAITLSALDLLFFRDGRPFTMGEDTFVENISYPPLPSVLYGSLVSSNPTIYADFVINNIWLQKSATSYFPLPKDFIVPKTLNSKDTSFKTLPLLETLNTTISNNIMPSFLKHNKSEKLRDGKYFVGLNNLRQYINGNKSLDCIELDIQKEIKIGIGRNTDTHRTNEGQLYKVPMFRPEDYAIGVEYTSSELISLDTIVALGGERRVIQTKKITPLNIPIPNLTSKIFKIYLATPAIFKEGWYPKTLFKKYNLKFLTAAVDKPINVGGWDMFNNIPKNMLQAIPAGSVYYVEAETIADAQVFAALIHGNSISDYSYPINSINTLNTQKQGFGIAYIAQI